MEDFYRIPKSPPIEERLTEADALKAKINLLKPLHPDLWETIQEKLRIEWTYDSNAIEGSTLTLGETYSFLREGLTVHGKPFKDFLDAKNHAEAIDYLAEVIRGERAISEGLIKELNALLLQGVTHTKALDRFGGPTKKPARPGEYKRQPNHVLQPDGTIQYYIDPLQVVSEMERLVGWINASMDKTHPLLTGAIAHYNVVRIHPFDDGNGRAARLFMNLIFIKKGYPPAIVQFEQRPSYIDALVEADKGNVEPFIVLMADSLIGTQRTILADLEKARGLPGETM